MHQAHHAKAHEYKASQHVCIGTSEMFQMSALESFEKFCSLGILGQLLAGPRKAVPLRIW